MMPNRPDPGFFGAADSLIVRGMCKVCLFRALPLAER
jgi:hypothetical protein